MSTILTKLDRMQTILGYRFHDAGLLRCALTHPSAAENEPPGASYERLEFLGDAVVGFVVSQELFRQFPDVDEGTLTRLKVSLISGECLSSTADELGYADCIVMGLSERGTGARGMHSALENVYEAVVGALYLDGGIEVARDWVVRTLRPHLAPWRTAVPENPKSILQERAQAELHLTPRYELVGERGPAHAPTFVAECLVGERVVGRGTGASKKEAEAQAALAAMRELGYVDETTGPTQLPPDRLMPNEPIVSGQD